MARVGPGAVLLALYKRGTRLMKTAHQTKAVKWGPYGCGAGPHVRRTMQFPPRSMHQDGSKDGQPVFLP